MLDLKNRKYKILLHIVIIISFMILLLSIVNIDKYKGKFTFNNISSEKKVLSSVGDTLFASSKGYDEVEYKINYTLDQIEGVTKRDVIIRGKIDELDSKYAYFKEIHKNNITSTLSNNGREIEVRIKNVTLGEEHSINLKIVIEGAPNGKRITPEIYIKEYTGEETKINAESILVETRSVEGIVIDEDNLELSTIELSLYKNDEEIRRTFTDERGRFIFTDLEDGEYSIHLEEDNYELINDIVINDETSIEIKLRKVDKYNVEINKYIDKVKLVIDGKEYNYSYNDSKKIVQNIDKAKTISGEIEYKIVVENNSDKLSEVTKVIDERGEGLLFNKEKNPGWEEINDVLVYRPISKATLNPNEKREIKLVLDIENTKESKNYFNEAISKGEIKEKVTYLLNNEVIKEETVYEGDTIKEPLLNIDNFDGWYTDKNYTNKYDFKNEVNKDLILYGRTRIILVNHTVTFMNGEDIFYKDLEVLDMTTVSLPEENPTKEHYIFKKWVDENNEEFGFDTPIVEDITLYAVFEKVIEPTITISPSSWTKDDVVVTITNPNNNYSFMYKIDNQDYTSYNGEFTVNKNSTIYAYSLYNNVSSEETSLDITNIDKINPLINNLELLNITPSQAEIGFKIKDNESGINKYRIYLNDTKIYDSDTYTNLLNNEKEESYIVSSLEESTTYNIKVEAEDKVGNISYDEINITTPERVFVCQLEKVNNVQIEPIIFESLREALEYNNSGINCLTSTCEIKMLLDIEESNTILNGQDIVLNLNGKYINGKNSNTFINNGNLHIIDNSDDIGHIANTNGIAIKNNGLLIVGVNEETPSVSKTKPIIEGTTYGIENNSRLNYYDGIIIGNLAIKGDVTSTPYLYNVSIDTNSSNKQVATLNVIVDAEARRNSVYYVNIQDAVNESRSINSSSQNINQEEDKIQLIKNITLTSPLIIDETKKFTLDLNGYILTTSINDYVIKNKGQLTIGKSNYVYDSNVNDEVGSIIGTRSVILNDEGYINLQDGKIIMSNYNTSTHGISNKGILTIGDNGEISGDGKQNIGVYNYESAEILDGTGSIKLTGSDSIAIYNESMNDASIEGYTLEANKYVIYDANQRDFLLKNITTDGSGISIYQTGSSNLTLINSNLNSTYGYDSSTSDSEVSIDHCNIKGSIKNKSKKITIVDSSTGNVANYNGKMIIKNSNMKTVYDGNNSVGIDIENSTFTSIENEGTIDIEDSNFTSVYNKGTIDIKGSTFTSVNNSGSLKIDDSTLTDIYNKKNAEISNSTINSNSFSIQNYKNATVNVTNTIITTNGVKVNEIHQPNMIISVSDYYGGVVATNEANSHTSIYNNGILNLDKTIINNNDNSNVNGYYGIINSINGQLSMKNNSEVGNNFLIGIYNTGSVELGNNDDVVVANYPSIKGSTSAIKNDGVVKYYDGKFIGQADNVIDGIIDDIPNLYDLSANKNDNVESITLKSVSSNDLSEEYVARIGNTKYISLKDAIESVPNNNTPTEINLLNDIGTCIPITINNGQNIILKQNNHNMKYYDEGSFITNNGTLKIIDESNEIKSANAIYGNSFIINNGELTYENVITRSGRTGKNIVTNNGNLTINSGKIYTDNESRRYVIYGDESRPYVPGTLIINNNSLNITGGIFNTHSSRLIDNNGSLTITSGSFSKTGLDTTLIYYASDVFISNEINGTIEISGGTFEDVGNLTTISNEGSVRITGGTFNELGYEKRPSVGYNYRVNTTLVGNAEGANLTIEGGTFPEGKGILVENDGTAIIKNITINYKKLCKNTGTITFDNVTANNINTSENDEMEAGLINSIKYAENEEDEEEEIEPVIIQIGIMNIKNSSLYGNTQIISSEGTLNIINSDIESINTRVATPISSGGDNSILNIESGNITSPLVAIIIESGSLTLGKEGGLDENGEEKPSVTNPKIQGGMAGIVLNEASLNFYDGVVIGETAIYGGLMSVVEPNYTITSKIEDSLEYKYLEKAEGLLIKNDRSKTIYTDFNLAVEEAQAEDTLVLLSSPIIPSDFETVVIPSNKSLILDLNGNTITTNSGTFIDNNGTFKIVDNNENANSSIKSGGTFINNKGTLEIDSGLYSRYSMNSAFVNTGTMLINSDAAMEDDITSFITDDIDNDLEATIYNTGELTFNGVTIGLSTYVVENSGTFIVDDINMNSLVMLFTHNNEGGTVTFNDGIFTSENFVENDGSLTINGGTYQFLLDNNEETFPINNSGNLKIMNGNIIGYGSGVLASDIIINNTGTASIEGGTYPISGERLKISILGYDFNYSVVRATLINNEGTATIKDITIDYKEICKNSGTITFDGITSNNSTSSKTSFVNTGTLSILNSTIETEGNVIESEGTLDITNSELGGEILINSSLPSTINSSTITSSNVAITKDGAGALNIDSGTITGTKGIENRGDGNINVGKKNELDHNVSLVSPKIEGNTYGINNTNSNSKINIYDGFILGSTSIVGTINEIEVGYKVIVTTENSKEKTMLSKNAPIKNKRTGIEYNSIQECVDAASNNDELVLLSSSIILSNESPIVINQNKELTLNLNGKSLFLYNELLLENKGKLTVIDDTVQNGEINSKIVSNNAKIFKNSGTLIINSGIYENKENSTSNLIENTGTLKINNLVLTTELKTAESLILNNGELEINGGKINTKYTKIIDNYGNISINGGEIEKVEDSKLQKEEFSDYIIYNSINSEMEISAGTVKNYGSKTAIDNDGVLNISGGTLDNYCSIREIDNKGTLNITSGNHFSRSCSKVGVKVYFIDNKEITNILGGYFEGYGSLINNTGTATIKDVTINFNELSDNSGTLTLTNVTAEYTTNSASKVIYNTGTLSMTGGSYNFNSIVIRNERTATLDGVTINSQSHPSISQKTGSSVTLKNINFESSDITVSNNGTINFESGSIISNGDTAISSSGTLNLGTEGGVPDTNNPYVKGKTYGINNSRTFNYYDGRVIGETGSISGSITKTEENYREQRETITDNETNITTIESTLTPIGEVGKVAVVNNINFSSLQAAINYAVESNYATIVLYSNVILEDNLTKPEGIDVKVYLNGRTITQGNYIIDEGITLIDEEEPSGVLDAIYKFFANILGTEINPKNIIIYQMNDGEELESNEIYHLYKLIDGDYKLIKLDEESISEYKIGKETTDLRTNRGKIFINDIGEGSYKLISEDKELMFEINANSVSSNIRINTRSSNKRISTSEASLIIMIKTGIIRHPFIFILLVLLITIVHLILFKKYIEKRE